MRNNKGRCEKSRRRKANRLPLEKRRRSLPKSYVKIAGIKKLTQARTDMCLQDSPSGRTDAKHRRGDSDTWKLRHVSLGTGLMYIEEKLFGKLTVCKNGWCRFLFALIDGQSPLARGGDRPFHVMAANTASGEITSRVSAP